MHIPVMERLFALWSVVVLLVAAEVVTIFMLLVYLNQASPNAALTALLGVFATALGSGLKDAIIGLVNGSHVAEVNNKQAPGGLDG